MRLGVHLPLHEYADAGAREVLLWPSRAALQQLERGVEAVASK